MKLAAELGFGICHGVFPRGIEGFPSAQESLMTQGTSMVDLFAALSLVHVSCWHGTTG